jgi:hypothetical protein
MTQSPTHSQVTTPHTVMHISCDGRRRESTYEEPIWVIQLKSEGHSFCEMQQKTALGKTAIHRIVNDWSTIINVWSMQKAHFRKVMQVPKQRPHDCEEVIVVTQRLWEELLWECI